MDIRIGDYRITGKFGDYTLHEARKGINPKTGKECKGEQVVGFYGRLDQLITHGIINSKLCKADNHSVYLLMHELRETRKFARELFDILEGGKLVK